MWAKRFKCADRAHLNSTSYVGTGSTRGASGNNGYAAATAAYRRKLNSTSKSVTPAQVAATSALISQYPIEWIRCSNPTCGKWRAVARGVDIAALVRRMNKRRFGANNTLLNTSSNASHNNRVGWVCFMNTWDETVASCTAPQESVWSCKWNLSA